MEALASVDFQTFVDEVIDKNDITDVISEYANVKRVGNRFSALCPLHNDRKSPSLSISPDKQLFHCFGCGAGGNVIHFIMAAEHLEFTDALKYLADRAKIPYPEFSKSSMSSKSSVDKKQLIYEINAEAAKYFYSNLAGDKGKEALEYLRNRGIKNSTIKMFGLGYAPEGFTNLIEYLKNKGYNEHQIYEAGLAKVRDNNTYFDAFYDGRIMIPYFNVAGKIIGFGGRIMADNPNTGKYLNTAETLVFKKKENLFGLNLAKKNTNGALLLMEGYMDVISLHQAGITNAVASCGTAFTEEQARLVKKYGEKAVLCYDSDEAGQKATLRAGDILSANNIKAKVLTITDGKDPDEYIRNKGGDMFNVLIENAKPLVEYKIDRILQKYNVGKPESPKFADSDMQIEFTQKAAEVLAQIKSPVEYEIYLKKVSENTSVSTESLNAAVMSLRHTISEENSKKTERELLRAQNRMKRERGDIDIKIFNAEQMLLCLLCEKDVYDIAVKKGIVPDDFIYGIHGELARLIFEMYEKENEIDINKLISDFDEEKRSEVAKILMSDKNVSDKKKASVLPIEIIISQKDKKSQERLLSDGDLARLDRMLKEKAGKKS